MNKIINIYTDGACSRDSGMGGYSAVVYDDDTKTINMAYFDSEEDTTNNRMEIKGLLKALELATKKYPDNVCLIYCDSSYCVNMFNEWIRKWAQKNWTKDKEEVIKNFDLVKELYEYEKIEFPNFQVIKCKGHDIYNIGNALADAYAVMAKSGDTSIFTKIIKENEITLNIE